MSYEWREKNFMSTNKSTSEIDNNDFNAPVSMQTNVIEDNGEAKSQQYNNRIIDKENNHQIIQGDKNTINNITIKVDKDDSKADASEKIGNPKEEIDIEFIITGSLKKTIDKRKLKAIEKHLQKIADDVELTIVDIDEGSLKFVLKGSPEGLKRIEELFKSGELTEIFEVPIESVEFIEPEKEKLAFTITGDVSYTDVAKLKAAVTGIDEKKLLIQKIRTDGGGKKLNLSLADLTGADLTGANLTGADLFGADLFGANFTKAELIGANLIGVDLRRANLHGAELIGANLRGANLFRAKLIGVDLIGANLRGANLIETDLIGAKLIGVKLKEANLSGARLREVKLEEANLAIVVNLSGADLSRANFRKADLLKADLIGVNLIEANLTEANLHGVNLSGADLIGANLHGAELIGANLRGADLRGANLIEVNLIEVNLHGADLSGADFRDANLSGAELICNKVTNAKFSSNSPGMTEKLKQDLIERGAIFEDSLEEPLILTSVGS